RRGGLFKVAKPPYNAREALLINRYCSSLNRPPQPSLCEGIPALLRRGMAWLSWTVLPRRGENSPHHAVWATAPSARVWVLDNVEVTRKRTRAEARDYRA